jgi:excisionase family DNA binding protein
MSTLAPNRGRQYVLSTTWRDAQVTTIYPAPLLTAAETAERLNVSPRWVYRQALAGELPCLRLADGPRAPFRVDPADLEDWVASVKERSSRPVAA